MSDTTGAVLPAPGDVQSWQTLAPLFAALHDEPLGAASVPAWLERWSDLQKLVSEVRAGLHRTHREDMTDQAATAAWLRFNEDIWGPFQAANQELTDRLLALDDYTPPPRYHEMFRRLRAEVGDDINSVPEGAVYSQDPPKGTPLPKGGSVNIRVRRKE